MKYSNIHLNNQYIIYSQNINCPFCKKKCKRKTSIDRIDINCGKCSFKIIMRNTYYAYLCLDIISDKFSYFYRYTDSYSTLNYNDIDLIFDLSNINQMVDKIESLLFFT